MLTDLARVRVGRGQEVRFGKLLSGCAAAGGDGAGPDVVEDGADDALDVEARVGVETLVLDGDRGLDRDRADVLELHREAVVALAAHVPPHPPLGVGAQGVSGQRSAGKTLNRGPPGEE